MGIDKGFVEPSTFQDWAGRPPERRALMDGAILVARIVEPSLDIRAWSIVIQGILRKCIADVSGVSSPIERFQAARARLKERFGLEGDLDDFYNPFNICLHKVMTRGLGVPVSLGVIWMTLGRLCGLEVRGTRMPGHFMMEFSHHGRRWYVDPFHPERDYDEEGCKELFSAVMSAGGAEFAPQWLETVDDKDVVVRMLALALEILSAAGDHGRALMTTGALLDLEPNQPRHFQRRASLFEEIGDWHRATDAWESCRDKARTESLREHAIHRLRRTAIWTHGYH